MSTPNVHWNVDQRGEHHAFLSSRSATVTPAAGGWEWAAREVREGGVLVQIASGNAPDFPSARADAAAVITGP